MLVLLLPADRHQVESLVKRLAVQAEVADLDLLRARHRRGPLAGEAPVVQALARPARQEAAQAQRVQAQRRVELAVLGRHQPEVARGAEQPVQLDPLEARLAQLAQLMRVVLDVVVGVDDLVGPAERQPVRGDEHGHPAGLQDARHLGQHALGIGHVLDRLHREHGREAGIRERQLAHVGGHRLALLALQHRGIQVHADRLARREQPVAVPHPAAEVEHTAGRKQLGAQLVGGHMALPGRPKAALGSRDPLPGNGSPRHAPE